MSKRCSICGKKSMVANIRTKLRGKYNPTGKKRKYPNLQWVTLGSGKRVKACTRCIKTIHKVKKPKIKKIKAEIAKSKPSAKKTKTETKKTQ